MSTIIVASSGSLGNGRRQPRYANWANAPPGRPHADRIQCCPERAVEIIEDSPSFSGRVLKRAAQPNPLSARTNSPAVPGSEPVCHQFALAGRTDLHAHTV